MPWDQVALRLTPSGVPAVESMGLSTLVIAVRFNPLRVCLQRRIDRRFYRRRYDAERALQAFVRMARNEADLDQLAVEVSQAVDETVPPACVSIWLQVRDSAQEGRF